MTGSSVSGSLGNVQLMAFAHESCLEQVRLAAKELGFARTHIVAGKVQEATEHLKQNASPEILLIEIGTAEEASGELDALANYVNPLTKVMATGKVDSIRFYQWLSDLGIDGYLLQPFTAAELKQAIAKGAIKKPADAREKENSIQKTFAVIGARGGVGSTMVSVNLAALFAREHQINTAVVDLDPYFGSVALSLDLEPGRGLRDAFEKPDRVDALFLERVMVKPFPMFSALSAEEPLMDLVQTQPNAGEMIFGALREKFQVIVVDVGRQMNAQTRHALAHADQTLIVADPQLPSLRDTLRIHDYLESMKCPKPLVLLNRVGLSSAHELPPKEFAKNYGHEIAAQLPYLPEIMIATAQGELLSSNSKLSGHLSTLRKLTTTLLGKEAAEQQKKAKGGSLLGRLKGGA